MTRLHDSYSFSTGQGSSVPLTSLHRRKWRQHNGEEGTEDMASCVCQACGQGSRVRGRACGRTRLPALTAVQDGLPDSPLGRGGGRGWALG